MHRAPRGVTLIEALLTAFIVLLVGALTATVVINAKVLAVTTQDESNAALDLQASTWLLTREISESAARTVTVSTRPCGIAFASARDASGAFHTDANGRPVWQKYVVYWVDGGLYRAEAIQAVRGPLPSQIFPLLKPRHGRRISEGIQDLRAQIAPHSSMATLRVLWSGPTSQGKVDQSEMTFKVTLWN